MTMNKSPTCKGSWMARSTTRTSVQLRTTPLSTMVPLFLFFFIPARFSGSVNALLQRERVVETTRAARYAPFAPGAQGKIEGDEVGSTEAQRDEFDERSRPDLHSHSASDQHYSLPALHSLSFRGIKNLGHRLLQRETRIFQSIFSPSSSDNEEAPAEQPRREQDVASSTPSMLLHEQSKDTTSLQGELYHQQKVKDQQINKVIQQEYQVSDRIVSTSSAGRSAVTARNRQRMKKTRPLDIRLIIMTLVMLVTCGLLFYLIQQKQAKLDEMTKMVEESGIAPPGGPESSTGAGAGSKAEDGAGGGATAATGGKNENILAVGDNVQVVEGETSPEPGASPADGAAGDAAAPATDAAAEPPAAEPGAPAEATAAG
ncbi:unnamed protein product [Amoebophrya sp. A120]|nr:unnamed protein product [Amoebophrya sp. A120]|eukprot:GSA120T00005832001.1